jgi:hypothetical protein
VATRITYRTSVTFEYDLQPVQTYRGEIVVANARLGARRAMEQAQKAFPNAKPRSMVVVLEELTRGVDQPSKRTESARASQPAGVM